MGDTTEIRRRKFEVTPPKVGLAMQVLGHYLMGAGAITSVSGTKTTFITIIVWAGFFIGGAGGFISTLYTDTGSPPTLLNWTPRKPLTQTIDKQRDAAQNPNP